VAEPATGGGMVATPDIDEESLEKFVAAYKQYWEQTGELPQQRIWGQVSYLFRNPSMRLQCGIDSPPPGVYSPFCLPPSFFIHNFCLLI
jgi:hypothetical protein